MKIKLSDLKKISNYALPGERAHLMMSPKMRKSAAQIREQKTNYKESAVLIMVYEKEGQLFLPLIQRNSYDGAHSGQVSFPGGKKEEEDTSFTQTALRECHEEIGIRCQEDNVIKELTEIYIPPSNFMVKPFLALFEGIPDFKRDPIEVDQIIEYPLSNLLDETNKKEVKVFLENYGMNIKVPAFVFKEYIIWGATAIILSEFRELIFQLNH